MAGETKETKKVEAKVEKPADGTSGEQGEKKTPTTLLGTQKEGEEKVEKKEEKSTPTIPETYGLTKPKDSPLADAMLETVTALAKQAGVIDPKQAQAFVDAMSTEGTAILEAHQAALEPGGTIWTANQERMKTEALAHASIGGSQEKLDAEVEAGVRFLKTHNDPALNALLEETGLGSDIRVIRLLAAAHRRGAAEDRHVPGTQKTGGKKTDAERWGYDKHTPPRAPAGAT